MKRFVTFVTVFALALSICACSKSTKETTTDSVLETDITTETINVEEYRTDINNAIASLDELWGTEEYEEAKNNLMTFLTENLGYSTAVANVIITTAEEELAYSHSTVETESTTTETTTEATTETTTETTNSPTSTPKPTTQPTTAPTSAPVTTQPTSAPTQPTTAPTQPTAAPTAAPTPRPTTAPAPATPTPVPQPSTVTATCPQCGDTYQVPSNVYDGNDYVYPQYHSQCSRERVWATIENSETGEELCTIYGWRYFDNRGLIWDNGVDPDTLCERYWDNEGIITCYYGN